MDLPAIAGLILIVLLIGLLLAHINVRRAEDRERREVLGRFVNDVREGRITKDDFHR